MGSFGERWLECYWCGRPGQCCLDATEPLFDIDAWGGIFCLPCYERGYPPHHNYLQKLLDVDWNDAVMIAQFTYPACSPYLGETPIEDTLPSAAAATAASSSSLPQLLQLPTNQIDDYDLTDDEYDEDLFLALSHEEALCVAGYNDDGSDLSEEFLDRRRGEYARRARISSKRL